MDVSMYGNKLRDNICYQMFSETCVPVEDCTIEQINNSIEEIKAMIDHSISLNDKSEIAYWRGALQNARNHKRSIVTT